MKGLIMKKEWADLIMSGKKTVEIRNFNTKTLNEDIYILESGSHRVRGICRIAKSEKLFYTKTKRGVIPEDDCREFAKMWNSMTPNHCVNASYPQLRMYFGSPYAWTLSGVRPVEDNLYYRHLPGAQIWIKDVELQHEQKGVKE